MRVEVPRIRRVLAVLTPVAPLVSAGLVGPDLVISSTTPEAAILCRKTVPAILPSPACPRITTGSDGNLDTGADGHQQYRESRRRPSLPASLRDLKIKLAGVDSQVQVGDQSDDRVTVGRDLIISMPATHHLAPSLPMTAS